MTDTTFPIPLTPETVAERADAPASAGVRRAIAAVAVAAVAIAAFAVTAAVRSGDDATPAPTHAATESDLREAAEWARRLEATNPELFTVSPKPATFEDLRYAAEWARRSAAMTTEP